ncbi:NADP-dependent oxidoreductase [Blastomonas sp. UPD001]|uniref:NADP-dependent oxidoreductase n=1 Tax=Blastomonas sp. UPD001 TaxID=2217673 RepID=UPI000E351B18|nr:NADP-dependent oxidoreductase [Blastomonas sp. UPD001]
MKAARVHAPGGREAVILEVVPDPAGNGVRVRIEAAGVNPVDWKLRAGWFAPAPLPFILGQDVAGVVTDDAHGFRAGERVFAMLPMDTLGAYAERVVADRAALAPAPASLDALAAAAVPMGALTALAALDDVAELRPGERVLVHGAGGAVGSFAAQIAKGRGCWVAATASGDNLSWLSARGIDLVIDYRSQRFEEAIKRPVDLVVDVTGGETQARSWALIANGGRMVSTLGSTEPPADAASRGVRPLPGFGTTPNGARLREVAAMIDAGDIAVRPPVALPLEEAAEALDRVEYGRAHGKIVLVMGEKA